MEGLYYSNAPEEIDVSIRPNLTDYIYPRSLITICAGANALVGI